MAKTLTENSKPLYQPWNEEVFQADPDVRYLTVVQRWMYRTLCQAAFFCTTRPYLPDDDKQLWKLAGCESREQWETNKEPVREMFTPVVTDGQSLLSRKRIVEDWNKLAEYREKQAEKGRKSAQKRAKKISTTEPQFNSGSTTVDHGTTTVNQISKEKLREIKKREVNQSEENSDLDGGMDGQTNHSNPMLLSNSFGQDLKNIIFDACKVVWEDYAKDLRERTDLVSEALPALSLSGIGLLKVTKNVYDYGMDPRDIGLAFEKFLKDRYEKDFNNGKPILYPLAIFAENLEAYVWRD